MGRAIAAISGSAVALLPHPFAHLAPALKNLLRRIGGPFDGYRPEQHYMRGPGPKYRARHGDMCGGAKP
jgi:hypothetical protein